MRLICPNCGAQYEVDPDAIPVTGRDVQCSNCGHGWYQPPPDGDGELAAEMGQTLREDIIESATPEPDEAPAPPEPEIGDPADDIHGLDDFDDAYGDAPEDDGPAGDNPVESAEPELPEIEARVPDEAAAAPVRPARPERGRRLDPEIASVLREEAAREAAVRRAESEGLETQPDLGFDDSADTPRRRPDLPAAEDAELAEIVAEIPDSATDGDGRGSRRELLPDIEEINSTLRPADATDRADDAAPAATTPPPLAQRRKRGARSGFLLVAVLAVLALAVYHFAPAILRLVPAAAPYLEAYVTWVNELRPQINQGVDTSIGQVKGLIGSLTGGGGGTEPPAN